MDSVLASQVIEGGLAPPRVTGESPLLEFEGTEYLRPQLSGKFLFVGHEKFWVRGATYGTFRPCGQGVQYPPSDVVENDFAQIAAAGLNTVRTYTTPPRRLLDAARLRGLRVMVGLPWEQHITSLDDRKRAREIVDRARRGVRACAGHPAVLCYSVGVARPSRRSRQNVHGGCVHL